MITELKFGIKEISKKMKKAAFKSLFLLVDVKSGIKKYLIFAI